MGAVYVVEQLGTGARRALKLMLPELVADARLRQRFEQEARIGAQIESDHVVQVVAAGLDAATATPWLAMELLNGTDLAGYLRDEGPVSSNVLLSIFEQLCHAMAAAHAIGIVHRDLKPENIFVTRARRPGSPFTVKVLDFGIAKMVAEAKTNKTAAIGTPMWMAPEQTSPGQYITQQTDVWALGLIAFWMLTGRSYWRAANLESATISMFLREILIDDIPPASVRAREFGSVLAARSNFDGWFAHCVARDPRARFADAGTAFSALIQTFPTPPTTPTASECSIPGLSSRSDNPSRVTEPMTTPSPPVMLQEGGLSAVRAPVRQEASRSKPRSLTQGLIAVASVSAGALVIVFALIALRRSRTTPDQKSDEPPEFNEISQPDGSVVRYARCSDGLIRQIADENWNAVLKAGCTPASKQESLAQAKKALDRESPLDPAVATGPVAAPASAQHTAARNFLIYDPVRTERSSRVKELIGSNKLNPADQKRILDRVFGNKYLTDVAECRVIGGLGNAVELPDKLAESRKAGHFLPALSERVEGAFTTSHVPQILYLIANGECGAGNWYNNWGSTTLAVLQNDTVVAQSVIDGGSVMFDVVDLDDDGKDEVVLSFAYHGTEGISGSAEIVHFDGRELVTVKAFGQVYQDSCTARKPPKQATYSIIRAVTKSGAQPVFQIERKTQLCP